MSVRGEQRLPATPGDPLQDSAGAEAAHDASGVRVTPYAGERGEWDTFVHGSPAATFFHDSRWLDAIEQSFGYRRRDLVARRDGRVVGVLPLCELSMPFARTCLLSLPFAVEAGVCAADPEAARALERAAVALAAQHHVRYVELRDGPGGAGFSCREGTYFRFRRPLYASDEENWRAIPRKQRRMVRVGQRSGLRVRVGTAELAVFHDLYARTARRHGSPVFGVRYFRRLLASLGNDAILMTAWHGEAAVAGVLSFVHRDTILPYYAGSRRELLRYAPNDFLYWELMCHAARRGLRQFDFGRSKAGSGVFAFKRHWGFEPEPLRYRVHALGSTAPARSLDDPLMRRLRHYWARLPLPLTKLAGPLLVRQLGPYYT